MKPGVFIVEDHEDMRSGLSVLLEVVAEVEVRGSAASAEEALDSLAGERPDLVIVDVSLPGMSGIDLVRRLRELYPDLRCLVISGHAEDRFRQPALDAGAFDYVVKDQADAIVAAVQRAVT
jgi:DNA-binding NarL/FixJ family response regulator